MINLGYGWRAVRVLSALRICKHGRDRTATPRVHMIRRLMRVLASGLILNATFPFDVLAQTAPASPPSRPQPSRSARNSSTRWWLRSRSTPTTC